MQSGVIFACFRKLRKWWFSWWNVIFFIISHIPQSPKGTPRPPPKHRRPFDVLASQRLPLPSRLKPRAALTSAFRPWSTAQTLLRAPASTSAGPSRTAVWSVPWKGCSPLWLWGFAVGTRTGSLAWMQRLRLFADNPSSKRGRPPQLQAFCWKVHLFIPCNAL